MARESRQYTMEEVCDGICSLASLSRIENGEREVEFVMVEALMDRMKLFTSEYEFILEEDDYASYEKRQQIALMIQNNQCEAAEKQLSAYEKKYGRERLHHQFILIQKAKLEQKVRPKNTEHIVRWFTEALKITAPDYEKKYKNKEILSNRELECIAELLRYSGNEGEQEKNYEELYQYFLRCRKREHYFPVAYRTGMQYYAEVLYKNGNYRQSLQLCNEILEELYLTCKLENRTQLFLLRAENREKLGFSTEEEKEQCLKDFLTAYYVTEFFDGTKEAEPIKQHIEEKYQWQFTE